MRPSRGPYAAPLPPNEEGRQWLTFALPFLAFLCVAAIIVVWGVLFLWLAALSGEEKLFGIPEYYALFVDLAVVCLVMAVATFAALRADRQNRQSQSAIH